MGIEIENRLVFNDSCSRFPEDVVRDYIKPINEQTREFVSLNILPYYEELDNDGVPIILSSLSTIRALTRVRDVQDKLGEIDEKRTRYEVYFGSRILDKYKYRVMFIEYGIGGYPAKLYIARDIVKSINRELEVNNTQIVYNEKDLTNVLNCIFTCDCAIQLFQEIINASKRKLENETRTVTDANVQDSIETENSNSSLE